MKKQAFFSYLVCGTLFFMWQTANSLAIYSMPALADILYIVFAVHYVVGGVGLLAAGLLCDKIILAAKARQMFAIALAAAGGVCALFLCFIGTAALFVTVFLLGTFLGFAVNGVLLGGLFVPLPQAYKPLGFGLAFAISASLRLPVDISVTRGYASHAAHSLFAAVALFLLCAALFSKPVAQHFAKRDDEAAAREPMVIGSEPRLFGIAVACGAAVFISFGIVDRLFSASPMYTNSVQYFRYAQILTSAAVGFICLRFGYYAAVLSSVSFLGLGTLAYLFGMSGAVGEMFVLFTVIGFNLFYHTLRSIFAEIGKHGKYPYTIAAFGFALYFMTQIIGIPVADGMDSLGKDGGTVVYVGLFMLSIPLIVLLFYRLHNAYAARQAVSPGVQNEEQSSKSMSSLTLTRREKEIFDLVLQGQLSREIAEVLFVSESTVNWHVANILKKTDVESRAELIERYGGD